jgi:hypothetical protein
MILRLLSAFLLVSVSLSLSAQSVTVTADPAVINLSGNDSINVQLIISSENFTHQLFLSVVSSDLPGNSVISFPIQAVNHPYLAATVKIKTPEGMAAGQYKVKIKAANGPVESFCEISVKYEPMACVWETIKAEVPSEFSGFFSMVIDSNNTKWFGTGYGIVKYDGFSWMKYPLNYFNHTNGDVLDIDVDQKNHIWFVSSDGLTWFNGSSYTTYNYKNSQLPQTALLALEIGKDGQVYIGTRDGLVVFDGRFWTTYNTSNSGIPFNLVRKVRKDKTGNIWLISGALLAKFDGQNWTTYSSADFCSTYDEINDVGFDSEGNLWLGVFNGGLIKKSETEVEQWSYELYVKKRLSDCSIISQTNNFPLKPYSVSDIYFNSGNELWLSGLTYTRGAVWRYKDGSWKEFSSLNSMLGQQNGYKLAAEKNGKIWTYIYKENFQGPFLQSVQCDDGVITDFKRSKSEIFKIFPNPGNGKVTIKGDFNMNSMQVIVADILGNTVYKSDAFPVEGTTLSLDLNHLVSGLYVINIKDDYNSRVFEYLKN